MLGQDVGFIPASLLIPDTSPSEEKEDIKNKIYRLCFLFTLQKEFQVGLTSQNDHRHQGRIPWSIGQEWNEDCRAASLSLWAPYWADVFVKGINSQPLAMSDICLSHGGCQKRIAVSVKLQVILHNAVLITMKAMAGLEFYSIFLLLFFAFVAQGGSLTKAAFCAQVSVTGPTPLLHLPFAFWQKGSAGTSGQGDDPTKHPYGKGSCSDSLQQQHGRSNFHLPVHGEPREGKHKSPKTLALACIHKWQKGTLHLDVWSHGEWHTQPLTWGSLKCL